MPTIVDGYNLLHATGIVGRGSGRGSLQRARLGLLNFLAAKLDSAERSQTSIVFDAKSPPPGLPRELNHRGMTVYFAAQFEDADALIEQLVRTHSTPRQLTVVSSDHRLQRAARRRRATAIDSECWYEQLLARNQPPASPVQPPAAKPAVPLSSDQIEYWLHVFGETPMESEVSEGDRRTAENDETIGEMSNPFPPGYGEDILREFETSQFGNGTAAASGPGSDGKLVEKALDGKATDVSGNDVSGNDVSGNDVSGFEDKKRKGKKRNDKRPPDSATG